MAIWYKRLKKSKRGISYFSLVIALLIISSLSVAALDYNIYGHVYDPNGNILYEEDVSLYYYNSDNEQKVLETKTYSFETAAALANPSLAGYFMFEKENLEPKIGSVLLLRIKSNSEDYGIIIPASGEHTQPPYKLLKGTNEDYLMLDAFDNIVDPEYLKVFFGTDSNNVPVAKAPDVAEFDVNWQRANEDISKDTNSNVQSIIILIAFAAVLLFTVLGVLIYSFKHQTPQFKADPRVSIEKVMTKGIFTVHHNASIIHAAALMNQHHVGSLVVKSERKVLGIVTEKDILTKAIAGNTSLDSPVERIMTKKIITADQKTSVFEAARVMTHYHLRRLIVRGEGKVKGVLTVKDILRMWSQEMESDLINQVPKFKELRNAGKTIPHLVVRTWYSGKVVTLPKDKTLSEVAKLMYMGNIGAVIVSDPDAIQNQGLYGIITERDFIRKVLSQKLSLEEKAKKIATPGEISIDADASLIKAISLMNLKGIRHLVVRDAKEHDEVIGVLSARDIARALVEIGKLYK